MNDNVRKILFVELLEGISDILSALPAIHTLARSHWTAEIMVLTLSPGGELLESDPIITHVGYADSNPRKSVEALLKCYLDLIVSDTNYYRIEELIQYSGASGVITNL